MGRASTSERVEVLRTGLQGIDDEFLAGVEDEDNQLEDTAGGVDAEHQPSSRVVLVVEWLAKQDVASRVEDDGSSSRFRL